MKKFGILKSKMLSKLTESYAKENRKEVKNILNTIKENKDFKEMYLFYEEIENMELSYPESAQLYVETIEPLLMKKSESIKNVCDKISKNIGEIEYEKNDLYECLDMLSEKSNLNNIDKKLIARKKLVEHLKTKKEIKESINSKNFSKNETLLYSVLSNNFNVLYDNIMSEEEKREFKELITMSEEDVKTKIVSLKENILNKVEKLLTESNEQDFISKLAKVKQEVSETVPTKYNLFKLKELRNGLD